MPVDSDAETCNLLILNTNQCVSTRYGEVNGAGDEGFEAYTQHHFKTVSSNINILAGTAYWSTIKTLPASLPEPRSEDRAASFRHQGVKFRGSWAKVQEPRTLKLGP